MKKKRCHYIVKGRVQGVYFRAYTEKAAQDFCLVGWVRNLPDGTVEIEAEGDEIMVENFQKWLWQGSPSSNVRDVVYKDLELQNEQSFRIRY